MTSTASMAIQYTALLLLVQYCIVHGYMVNIALNKNVSTKSKIYRGRESSNTVDGDPDTLTYTYCSSISVDLGQEYQLYNINVGGISSLANRTLYVDNTTCHTFQPTSNYFLKRLECNETARYVTIGKSEHCRGITMVSEVEIYACSNGTYGVDCESGCHCSSCDRWTGNCSGGCEVGWRGYRCDIEETTVFDRDMSSTSTSLLENATRNQEIETSAVITTQAPITAETGHTTHVRSTKLSHDTKHVITTEGNTITTYVPSTEEVDRTTLPSTAAADSTTQDVPTAGQDSSTYVPSTEEVDRTTLPSSAAADSTTQDVPTAGQGSSTYVPSTEEVDRTRLPSSAAADSTTQDVPTAGQGSSTYVPSTEEVDRTTLPSSAAADSTTQDLGSTGQDSTIYVQRTEDEQQGEDTHPTTDGVPPRPAKSDVTTMLKYLFESCDDVRELIYAAFNITRNTSLDVQDVLLITDILEKTANLSQVSRQVGDELSRHSILLKLVKKYTGVHVLQKIAEDVLAIYDTVITTNADTLNKAQEQGDVVNRILRSLDDVSSKLQVGPTGKERLSVGTVVWEVWDLGNPNVTQLPIGLSLTETQQTSNDRVDSLYKEDFNYSRTVAAIVLPEEFLVNARKDTLNKNLKLSLSLHMNTALFRESSNMNTYKLNSKVVAAKIIANGEEMYDLNEHFVTVIFTPTEQVDAGVSKTCGYWNFSLSGWSTDGCVYSQGHSGRDVCTCSHLTHFAVLINIQGEADDNFEHSFALSVITKFGLSLSILGLSGTLLSLSMFRKLREKHPQQTLFNLVLAELCSWLTFLVGITQTQSRAGCTLVAILLHYFLLASFLWMLAEAFLHYLLLVRAQMQRTLTTRYMLKTGLLAWGLPVFPIVIVLAVDLELYSGNDAYCWMSPAASLYAFILPVGAVILFNSIVYILVVVKVSKNTTMRKQTFSKIRVPLMCFVLFGLSWIFGFLAVYDAKVVFQYLFCLTSSIQGFLIFIFFTARNEEVRDHWSKLCFKKEPLLQNKLRALPDHSDVTENSCRTETSV